MINWGKRAINWKNTAENLGIVLVGVVFGAMLGYTISIKTAKVLLDQQKSLIERAIDKETIKNEITNEIKIEIDKIKKSDSINININQSPDNKQDPTNIIIKKQKPEKKKGFFGRLFSKKE